ncbi:MAG: hypothetical protein HY300_02065 [Verrucomicrobia bacterium]|nr:hypothetical protein [Verrucomicrobiota bacterium]
MSDTQIIRPQQDAPGPVAIPLAAVVAKLHPPLTMIVAQPPPPDATIKLELAQLQEQLPTGSVKIPFFRIRTAGPPGVFSDSTAHDEVLVTLPLDVILPRLPASLLARRPDQKVAFMPVDMKPPFLKKGDPSLMAPAPAPHPHAPKPSTAVARGSTASSAFLKVPISELSAGWPEGLRREITLLGINGLALPSDDVGAALKTGRVAYSWKQIRGWAVPTPNPQPSAYDETTLTLPLSVLTPLYLNHQYRMSGQSGNTAFISARSRMTPADVVRSALGLPGVAGAFVSSHQGLIVAQQMPPGIVSDRVASLLPQAFERLDQVAGGLNLGEVTSLSLNAAGVMWMLFDAGTFFVGVAGRAGESLPATQLQTLVVELSR